MISRFAWLVRQHGLIIDMNTQYVALLRGINVGGNNMIKMADLKVCLESADYQNVTTYIQSGNVLFEAPKTDSAKLERELEQTLIKKFTHYQAWALVLSLDELQNIVDSAPAGYGSETDKYRYDVLFIRDPLTPAEVVASVEPKEGVDTIDVGPGAVYNRRLIARASSSRISRIVGMPIYQNITIRNWNTTTKLLAMMQAR